MSGIFDIEEQEQISIVHLHLPQIDMFNVTELLDDFKKLVESTPPKIILDLRETNFVDSSGMGGLIRIHQQIKAYEGRFVIANLNSKVANLMRITRSSQYLDCFDTLDEALRSLRS